jgi:hypothetical protein
MVTVLIFVLLVVISAVMIMVVVGIGSIVVTHMSDRFSTQVGIEDVGDRISFIPFSILFGKELRSCKHPRRRIVQRNTPGA